MPLKRRSRSPPNAGHYRCFHSARAELLRRAGPDDEARHAYRRALELAQTDAERRSLSDRLTQLGSG
jgi:RNA polymerase sigma-70 factor, ECF subfamily